MPKSSNIESSPSPFKEEDDVYYKVVRLKTGESILCSMSSNITSSATEPYLTLLNPVQAVLSKQMSKGDNIVQEMFILRPWIGLSNSREYVMPSDITLTIGNMKSKVKDQYIEYLNETHKAEEMLEREEEEEKMERAIFLLLTEVNNGGKVYIMKPDEDIT